MSYGRGEIPALLRTPVGRAKLAEACCHHTWPLFSCLAGAYRRSVVRNTRVVAVVGSYGKTTTTRAVAAALGMSPEPRARRNFSSFLCMALLRCRPSQTHLVVEVGIRWPGEMEQYARLLRPSLAVVTSIGSEHNETLGGLECTRAEKAKMIRALPASGLAVLNWDDPNVRWMAGQTQARVRRFGLGGDCEIRASDVVLDWPRGTRFTLRAGEQTREVRTRLFGHHHVYPILAGVAVALEEGFALDEVLPRLEALEPTAGRLEVVRLVNGALLLRDDFKASLETIDAALDLLAEVPARRRIVVLGEIDCPPIDQPPHYERLGERVGRLASRVVVVGEGETFQQYRVGARRAGLSSEALVHAGSSVHAAIELLRPEIGAGDVVLIKGRWQQRLDRIALALAGRRVTCDIADCRVRPLRCSCCPMLERGWSGLRVVT